MVSSSKKINIATKSGQAQPFGATVYADGINFAIASKHAKSVSIYFFLIEDLRDPAAELVLDSLQNKTGDVWHISVSGLPKNIFYCYRIDEGPLILDPYAKEIYSTNIWGQNGEQYRPVGAIVNVDFDWEGDRHPFLSVSDLIIYEMHVRGFTQDVSSDVGKPGTFLGIIEKIPHLLELGVNAIELMPVHEFNECEYQKIDPLTKRRLCQFWGYSTVNFFSPMQRYASTDIPGSAVLEFKTMVRELHKNGIEVILDVVFNHTAEFGEPGISLSFKELDNELYYILDDSGNYLNFSGCGNTLNCNQPIVRDLIIDSLRYWVSEMHVDGFRFDLASILTRGTRGQPLVYSPLIERISKDPILSKVKLIAEPWDAGGLYQVGSFYMQGFGRWSEWNGRYRDVVRSYIKGTGSKNIFVTNLCGSQDLYHRDLPSGSINFVTSHDGFTLADLVTYNRKHNFGNGEDNRDGTNNNDSWNCGIEGCTAIKDINKLRLRQMKNFHVALMVSRGTPMFPMGDEYGHTKHGNNNSWCQEELNYFLWHKLEQNSDFYRFFRFMIQFRKGHPVLCEDKFLDAEEIEWHGMEPFNPNWNHNDHFVAYVLKDKIIGDDLYIAFNAGNSGVSVEFPKPLAGRQWHWVVNTSKESPDDFQENLNEVVVVEMTFEMLPFSSIVLKSRLIS